MFDPYKCRPNSIFFVFWVLKTIRKSNFLLSVTLHVNLISLLRRGGDKLLLWLTLELCTRINKHTQRQRHTHRHLQNPNFPGAEVCRMELEPLIRKLHYSPSALCSIWAIMPSTTSMHIQMEFTTWQGARWGLNSTRVWVGSCSIASKVSSFSFSIQTTLHLCYSDIMQND